MHQLNTRRLFRRLRSLANPLFSGRRRLARKLICLALICNLLIWPGVEQALRQLPALAGTAMTLMNAPTRMLSGLMNSLFHPMSAARPETLADRLARVAHIQITPYKYVGYQEQTAAFNALASDCEGEPVHGVKFVWGSSDSQKISVDEAGRVSFLQPGLVTITCRAGSVRADVPVLVRPGRGPAQTNEQWRTDQNSLSDLATSAPGKAAGMALSDLLGRLAPTALAQNGGGADHPYDELWSEPRNLVGQPPFRALEPTRFGTVLPEGSNTSFTVPIVDLGGRGLAAKLALHYNSRVWTRRSNLVSFNAIHGWPYAGFSLGFGRILSTGSTFILIDPDGTRHPFALVNGSTYQTTDGTHITYVGNLTTGGTLSYNDGTSVTISAVNGLLLPTQITDANGNFIQVAYKNSSQTDIDPLAIDQVTDTLGRVITFKYNTNNDLIGIEVPQLTGQSPTRVQFDYQDHPLQFNFSGLTVENGTYNQNLHTLSHVYFPTSQTGFLFTYSSYGMIRIASMRRQMSINAGVISDGVESGNFSLAYPATAGTALTDVPTFSSHSESPGGSFRACLQT